MNQHELACNLLTAVQEARKGRIITAYVPIEWWTAYVDQGLSYTIKNNRRTVNGVIIMTITEKQNGISEE